MRCFLCLVLGVALPLCSSAATYYIDYATGSDANPGTAAGAPWKLCPGMPGFAGSHSHATGDRFIFRGGVTWPAAALPLTISFSGAPGVADTYGADRAWFAGAGWSQPTFDGEGVTNALVIAEGRSHFAVQDLHLVNAGAPQVANGKRALQLADCAEFLLAHNTIAPESWLGIYIYASYPGTYRNVVVRNNDISSCAMGIVVASSSPGVVFENVDLVGNHIHDFASQIGDDVHGDGIHVWGADGDDTQYVTNLRIWNNRFGGSFARTFGTGGGMTALIYIENATIGAEIFNNVLTYSDPPTDGMFESLISLRGNPGRGGGHRIHHNIFQGTTPGMSAAILLGDGPRTAVPGCEIRNNVLTGMQFGFYITSGSERDLVCDHNAVRTTSAVAFLLTRFVTLPELQALGLNLHGVELQP